MPMLCTFWGRKADPGSFPGPQLPQAYWGVHPSVGSPVSPIGSDSRLFFSLKKTPLRSLIFKDPASSASVEVLHLQVVASWPLPTASNQPPGPNRLEAQRGGEAQPAGHGAKPARALINPAHLHDNYFQRRDYISRRTSWLPPGLIGSPAERRLPLPPAAGPGRGPGRAGPRHELLGAVPAVGAAGQDLPRRAVPGGCSRYRPGSSWGIAPRPLGCGGAV